MANWAKLQETLTSLPVVKRAKHGIHFDNGDGTITANFSGKPCHYQDTDGLWKPIDTRLLLGADGFYGCPHSPVKVKPDGRVKVTGSDYSQFTKLPGSPLGRVDGDKIVREFPGGYQELFVTEDGFREVITVNKPTFPIEKFLAKQSGTLPSAYKTSPQTAVDANGNEFVITSDTKAFGDWLEGAVYPVVIDPDISAATGVGGDTYINSGVPDSNLGGYPTLQLSEGANNRRILIRFDESSIAAEAICTAAAMNLVLSSDLVGSSSYSVYKISDANGDWVEGTAPSAVQNGSSCWNYKAYNTATWAGSAGLSTAGTDYVNTVIATASGTTDDDANEAITFTYNADGLTVLQSWFGDATNNGLLITGGTNRDYFHQSENATESYRPVLSVTYTAAGGLLRRTNMNAQMQNLSGGIHG